MGREHASVPSVSEGLLAQGQRCCEDAKWIWDELHNDNIEQWRRIRRFSPYPVLVKILVITFSKTGTITIWIPFTRSTVSEFNKQYVRVHVFPHLPTQLRNSPSQPRFKPRFCAVPDRDADARARRGRDGDLQAPSTLRQRDDRIHRRALGRVRPAAGVLAAPRAAAQGRAAPTCPTLA